ncbi:aKG-HExxH-type peptide beta-hydroxylase [Streptomyces sp. AK08-02]|uniref:aKG-HExxH-type peptide beta-hydroxylase n=1 Tax=Streptomyces sp. AK08-02 TaxID=3028654 RepID=UPI0029B7F16B|nr:HEXXH motif-containing putative peptide modification protein [Streptomyces sp. AK08-02]MDX3749391.1 HEXXH motif-containing putative peptide modification protein [Streptomyces sp. AK08-02]
MNPSPYRMPGALFDAIAAGGGGAAALRLLGRAEHSRRLACAYAVTVAGRETGGAAGAAAEHAWGLFTDATRTSPEAVAAVLTHPSAGPALFGLLAQLRHPNGQLPPPVHWFTALAVSAAARAGLPTRAGLPLTGSWAALPSLGRARFPGARPGDRAEVRVDEAGHCRVTAAGETVAVPGLPYPGGPLGDPAHGPISSEDSEDSDGFHGATGRWHGARLLAVLDGGAPLLLDTLDPPCFPHSARHPDGISGAEAHRWAGAARGACRLLRADHPETYAELAAGPHLLVPLTRPGHGNRSGSSAETFGCMALSPPTSVTGLAVTLTHETQHNKLAALLHLFDLFEPGGPDRFYAPWRPDPRPLPGLFHGAYAHLGVALFWERRRETEPDPALRATAHAQFARWRLAAHEATTVALSSGRLTSLGHRFAQHMLTTLDTLRRLPVPAPALHHAESAARAHRADWQNRNGDEARRVSA